MYIYSATFSYYITQCDILIYITFLDLTYFGVDYARYTQHGVEHTVPWIEGARVSLRGSRYCNIMGVYCNIMGSTHVSWVDSYISVLTVKCVLLPYIYYLYDETLV